MKTFKEKHALSTAKATDLKSYVYNAGILFVILEKVGGTITDMDAGWDKTLLLVVFLGALSFINWLQAGNIPPQKADEINASEALEEVLKKGRQ